jgi:hypothetical protein
MEIPLFLMPHPKKNNQKDLLDKAIQLHKILLKEENNAYETALKRSHQIG